jgi:SAM-dependent methyltransferase
MTDDVTNVVTREDQFLAPRCTAKSIDTYVCRKAILQALSGRLGDSYGILLDIGCGYMPYRSLFLSPPSRVNTYIGLDLKDSGYSLPDLQWDGTRIPLKSASVDCAMAIEVLEHCPEPEVVLVEAIRVLKPGGVFVWTTPFLWPLHCVPHDEYRYTPFSLSRHLSRAGFENIRVEALGGWDASMAQMIALWVGRRPMAERKRSILSHLALPIVRYLLSQDRTYSSFAENTMVTGLFGTAVKPGL